MCLKRKWFNSKVGVPPEGFTDPEDVEITDSAVIANSILLVQCSRRFSAYAREAVAAAHEKT